MNKITDGYYSLTNKIGTIEDVTSGLDITAQNLTINRPYLAQVYNSIGILRNVIDIPVDDAFREGRIFTEKEDILKDFYETYDGVISLALKSARTFGGSFLYLDDNRPPMEGLLKGKLDRIVLLEIDDLLPLDSIQLNPLSDNYLRHAGYAIHATGETVHPSRLIYIDGVATNKDRRIENAGMGVSLIEIVTPEIQQLMTGVNRGVNILTVLGQDVLKIDGLNESLSVTESQSEIESRLMSINRLRGILSTLVIDAEDSYENVNRSLGGVQPLITELKEMVCSVARIPYSKLFGRSSGGLNSTGENEIRNFYDDVKSIVQVGKLKPIYEQIDEAIGMTAPVVFAPLYSPDSGELANIDKVKAETAKILIEQGILEDDEVKERFFN